MKTLNLQSVVNREDKYWVAQCLNIDVSSFGETEDKALELYFEDIDQPEFSEVGSPELKGLTLQSA
jgi:hypothetical protein